MNSDIRARGEKVLQEITGQPGAEVMAGVQALSPDLARWILDFCYGEVLSRPQLAPRDRQIATVAALTALGHSPGPLKVHLHGALNAGVTPEELLEVVLQMAVYAGFPVCLNAMTLLREVFTERGITLTPPNPKP